MNNIYIAVYWKFDSLDVILTSDNPNIVSEHYSYIETLNDLLNLISKFKNRKNYNVKLILNLNDRKLHLNTLVNILNYIDNIELIKLDKCKDSLDLLIKYFKINNLEIGDYIIKSL